MQRWCTKLRSLAVHSTKTLPSLSPPHRLLHSSPHLLHQPPLTFSVISSNFKPLFNASSMPDYTFRSSLQPFSLLQARHISGKSKKRKKEKERRMKKPMTPVTSKLKKTKMKSYSSFKLRFRTMNDGKIRRWKAGKLHNAHLKSKKSKRRLRLPALVHPAYAKVMKKLNFCG